MCFTLSLISRGGGGIRDFNLRKKSSEVLVKAGDSISQIIIVRNSFHVIYNTSTILHAVFAKKRLLKILCDNSTLQIWKSEVKE